MKGGQDETCLYLVGGSDESVGGDGDGGGGGDEWR